MIKSYVEEKGFRVHGFAIRGAGTLNIVPRVGLTEMGLPGKTCMEVGGGHWDIYRVAFLSGIREEPL